LAVAVAMNIGVWNIGADGQFYMGALFATAVGIFMKGDYVHMLIAMFVAGAVGGTVWILIPTLARVYAQVDEIITTLLLNFVALLLVYYVATGPWRDKAAAVISATPRIQDRVPSLMSSLHWGIVVALILTLIVSVAIRYTKWGYEVRVSGANKHAAHYAGMPVPQRVVGVMLLSGAIAGIAGMLEVAGTVGRLQGGISNNFGYLGIVVAVLASGSPIGVLLSAFFIALVLNSGIMLQTQGISTDTVLALTGLILMFAAVGHQFAHYKFIRTNKAVAAPQGKENTETASTKTPGSAPLTGSAIEAPAE
jgi:simple sugar transport system permease protein